MIHKTATLFAHAVRGGVSKQNVAKIAKYATQRQLFAHLSNSNPNNNGGATKITTHSTLPFSPLQSHHRALSTATAVSAIKPQSVNIRFEKQHFVQSHKHSLSCCCLSCASRIQHLTTKPVITSVVRFYSDVKKESTTTEHTSTETEQQQQQQHRQEQPDGQSAAQQVVSKVVDKVESAVEKVVGMVKDLKEDIQHKLVDGDSANTSASPSAATAGPSTATPGAIENILEGVEFSVDKVVIKLGKEFDAITDEMTLIGHDLEKHMASKDEVNELTQLCKNFLNDYNAVLNKLGNDETKKIYLLHTVGLKAEKVKGIVAKYKLKINDDDGTDSTKKAEEAAQKQQQQP